MPVDVDTKEMLFPHKEGNLRLMKYEERLYRNEIGRYFIFVLIDDCGKYRKTSQSFDTISDALLTWKDEKISLMDIDDNE